MKHYYWDNTGTHTYIQHPALDRAYQAFLDSGESAIDDCGYYDEYCGVFNTITDYTVSVFDTVELEEA